MGLKDMFQVACAEAPMGRVCGRLREAQLLAQGPICFFLPGQKGKFTTRDGHHTPDP